MRPRVARGPGKISYVFCWAFAKKHVFSGDDPVFLSKHWPAWRCDDGGQPHMARNVGRNGRKGNGVGLERSWMWMMFGSPWRTLVEGISPMFDLRGGFRPLNPVCLNHLGTNPAVLSIADSTKAFGLDGRPA